MEAVQSEFERGRRRRNGATDRKPRVDMFWDETKLLEKWIQLWFSLEHNPSIIFKCCGTFTSSDVFLTTIEIFFTPYFQQLETTGLFFYLFSVITLYLLCVHLSNVLVYFVISGKGQNQLLF